MRGDDWQTCDFRGLRVAIVADADEAARIVPCLVDTAASVKVFLRWPAWLLPSGLPAPGLLGRMAARLHLRMTVGDPWLRRQLTPFGDQRQVGVRGGSYAVFEQPGCKVYTWPVYAVVESGIRSAEGIEHRVDAIIVGAGIDLAFRPAGEERIA
jgi:cation diffusion facilitator CzcD-associated flavoprotein CzcO